MEQIGDRVLKTLFFLIWIIAIVHVLAEFNFWYWRVLWLDIPMHFVGGLWLGLGGLWLWNHSTCCVHLRSRVKAPLILVALAVGISIGLVWELYEYAVWTYSGKGLPPQYLPDTLLDLVMDTVGALVAVAVYRLLSRASSKSLESK